MEAIPNTGHPSPAPHGDRRSVACGTLFQWHRSSPETRSLEARDRRTVNAAAADAAAAISPHVCDASVKRPRPLVSHIPPGARPPAWPTQPTPRRAHGAPKTRPRQRRTAAMYCRDASGPQPPCQKPLQLQGRLDSCKGLLDCCERLESHYSTETAHKHDPLQSELPHYAATRPAGLPASSEASVRPAWRPGNG